MILLLAPLAAVPDDRAACARASPPSSAATTVDDARLVYQAIRLAQPGGLGTVADQDVAGEPTVTLREAMRLAADRDLVARQYANGYRRRLRRGACRPCGRRSTAGRPLETAIVAAYLTVLAGHPDTLIARKRGPAEAARGLAPRGRRSWPPAGPIGRRAGRSATRSTPGSAPTATPATPARRPT